MKAFLALTIPFWGLFSVLILRVSCESTSVFNSEISERVEDFLSSYLTLVSRAALGPYNSILLRDVNKRLNLTLTDPHDTSQKILYQTKLTFQESSNIYIGYETLLFYGYIGSAYQFTVKRGSKFYSVSYSVNPDGSKGTYLTNMSYDCRTRPWYTAAKSNKMPSWTAPYLSATTGSSVFNLGVPIYKNSSNSSPLVGVLSVAAYLTDITKYLVNAYSGTDRSVFIVDKSTGQLVASTLGVPVNTRSSKGVLQSVFAATCSDSLISGVTNKLINENWPSKLIIYEEYYLQNVLYTSSPYPGIAWYVVVLLPATLDVQYLGTDSALYNAVIAIVAVTFFITTLGMLITIFYRNTRLIKLTRPFFTNIIIMGGWILCVACLLLLNGNTESNCGARPWVFNLAFTLTFSPLLIKAWRVHIMFNVNPMSKNKLISLFTLASYTFSLVLLDAFLLAATLHTYPGGTSPKTTTKLSSNGAYAQVTYCGYLDNKAFYITEIVYKGILILLACYMSFKIRHIAGTIAGSKSLLVIIYNTGFITGVVLLIDHSISAVRSKILIQVCGICFCVILTVIVLVVPTFYQLLTVGDAAAADGVIDEIFNKNSSGGLGGGGGGNRTSSAGLAGGGAGGGQRESALSKMSNNNTYKRDSVNNNNNGMSNRGSVNRDSINGGGTAPGNRNSLTDLENPNPVTPIKGSSGSLTNLSALFTSPSSKIYAKPTKSVEVKIRPPSA